MLLHWKFRDSTELIGYLVAALPWSHKVTGKFLKVHGNVYKCMHVQGGIKSINAVTVQIKASATTFGHAHHHVNIVRLRFAVHLS